MTTFLVANIKVTNDRWIPTYAAQVHEIVARHGGKYLSRSANITAIEGPRPDFTVVALVQFPSSEALQAFIKDPEYAPLARARQEGSECVLYAIDDTDATGAIPYLPKSAA